MLNRLDGTWGVVAGFGFRTSTYCPLAPRRREEIQGFIQRSNGNNKTSYFSEGSNKLFKGGNYNSPFQNLLLVRKLNNFKGFPFIFSVQTFKRFIL